MNRILSVYITAETSARLEKLSREMGRTVEDLADSSVSEAALNAFRGRPRQDDPAEALKERTS